jgi:uncharacterized protein (TIGR00369 family)
MSRATAEEAQRYFDENFAVDFPTPSSAVLLGWAFERFDAAQGEAEVRFTATEEMLNPVGHVQGGILAAMIDDTMGPLMHLMSAGRAMPSTTDLHTQYPRPARPGAFRCIARIRQMGRQVCYTTGDLYDARDRHVAMATQTALMLPFTRG